MAANTFRAQVRAANLAYSSREKGNPIVSFLLNFILPIFFLTKYELFCSTLNINGIIFPFKLGTAHNQVAANALVTSLTLPILYFIYSCVKFKKPSVVSVIGIIGVFITGAVGLFELSSQLLAIKEAMIPLLLGFLILFSLHMKPPLIIRMVCNDQIMDLQRVSEALHERGNTIRFKRMFHTTTWLFFLDFLVSAVTHYILAVAVLVDPMPTNAQIAELMYLKYPYSVLPFGICIILTIVYLFHRMTFLTGMPLDLIFPPLEDNKK